MEPPRLIAFYSARPQSGKTVACQHIGQRLGTHKILPFAGPLKRVAFEFLCLLGLSAVQARRYLFSAKEEIIPELGVTGRHVLQTLGTDWGRDMLSPTVWVDAWSAMTLQILQDPSAGVLVDDMRFPNEFDRVRELGGYTVLIDRDVADLPEPHPSEGQLNSHKFDAYVVNDGTLQDLHNKLDTLFACGVA